VGKNFTELCEELLSLALKRALAAAGQHGV
jgi:hypothetical protein